VLVKKNEIKYVFEKLQTELSSDKFEIGLKDINTLKKIGFNDDSANKIVLEVAESTEFYDKIFMDLELKVALLESLMIKKPKNGFIELTSKEYDLIYG
tara:strand:- start:1681 stop:1974 length:294 start_codon:yes stop_codon:yes gene_type:complete